MRTPFLTTLNRYLRSARRWYERTPERALDQAYDAVLMIKAIEDEHFEGKKIPTRTDRYGQNTLTRFQEDLKNCLKIAELRLAEFKASRFIFRSTDFSANARSGPYATWTREKAAEMFEKLKFIDEVLERYRPQPDSLSLVPLAEANAAQPIMSPEAITGAQPAGNLYAQEPAPKAADGILDKTGVLPRSIIGTLNRIKRDLDPNSEEQVVQTFRATKTKTLVSIRFLLILIIAPLLTQQLSKTLVVGPIVDHFRTPTKETIFLNFELEEEALRELNLFKEHLEFDRLLPALPLKESASPEPAHKKPTETPADEHDKAKALEPETPNEAQQERKLLAAKVEEIAEDYYRQGSNAIKNVFADICASLAFAIVILTNRREVAVLKTFIDETVYGLSDSAKAFIIILFTDMFVGFHSPHGWEVLLEGIAKHFGLPARHDFIYLFIATFPVILDTLCKYWIFRYLNRISPSAVATYRNMNE